MRNDTEYFTRIRVLFESLFPFIPNNKIHWISPPFPHYSTVDSQLLEADRAGSLSGVFASLSKPLKLGALIAHLSEVEQALQAFPLIIFLE